jgi:hypothetical protein
MTYPLSRVHVSLLCLCLGTALSGAAEPAAQQSAPASMAGMAHMAGHMYMTTLRPIQPGDQQKADAIAAAAKAAMEPYQDYHKALADGYKLVGAMYTARVDATEDEINQRIPLSIAHWHQHINFCKAPEGQKREYFGPNAKFGLLGSITTKEACDAAGGEFHPHLFGWMVHVYPYETDPKKIWAVDDDDNGHDNMDHSAMPGMKMN